MGAADLGGPDGGTGPASDRDEPLPVCGTTTTLPDSKAGTERGGVTKKPRVSVPPLDFLDGFRGMSHRPGDPHLPRRRLQGPPRFPRSVLAPWLIFICLSNPVMVPGWCTYLPPGFPRSHPPSTDLGSPLSPACLLAINVVERDVLSTGESWSPSLPCTPNHQPASFLHVCYALNYHHATLVSKRCAAASSSILANVMPASNDNVPGFIMLPS